MTDKEVIVELIGCLEGAENMMAGMLLDPTIPLGAKAALREKKEEIEETIEEYIDSIED